MYGFSRFVTGDDKGAYYHLCFVKGHRSLVRNMVRTKIKGNKVRKVPNKEPNFYDPLWKNHFEASVPSPLQQSRTVATPKSTMKLPLRAGPVPSMVEFIVPPLRTTPLVDRLPLALTSQHASVSDSDDCSWRSALCHAIDLEFPQSKHEKCQPVTIPPSFMNNIPVHDNPLEPTPIRESLIPLGFHGPRLL